MVVSTMVDLPIQDNNVLDFLLNTCLGVGQFLCIPYLVISPPIIV